MIRMGKLDYRGTETEPQIHAFPEKRSEPGTIRGIDFNIKHTLPCHLLMKQQLYQNIQHKQAMGSAES